MGELIGAGLHSYQDNRELLADPFIKQLRPLIENLSVIQRGILLVRIEAIATDRRRQIAWLQSA